MVMDDEPVVRSVLTVFLNDCGFYSIAVKFGDDARDLIFDGVKIDLVFGDV